MKKRLALVLAFIFILAFVGCANNAYELPHDQFCYSIDNSQAVELKTADKEYIVNLLNDASWINALSNCGSEFVFYTQKQEIRYHSTCGTFNDITNKKSTIVTEEQRIAINTILEINDEPVSDKVGSSLKNLNTDTGTLYFSIRNNTRETFNYGHEFTLEKYENGAWVTVSLKESAFFTAEGILLLPEEENEVRVALAEYFDSLSAGTYRLTKEIYGAGNVSVTFDVKEEMNFSVFS